MSDNNWPDPARPGVPLNPERDGWHWISLLGGKDKAQVIEWFADAMRWDETDWTTDDFGLHTRYLGPILTPAEVDARVKKAVDLGIDIATRELGPQIAMLIPWQTAIEDALSNWCDAVADDETPKDALRHLIQIEMDAALDPKVSQAAADLVAKAKRDALAEAALVIANKTVPETPVSFEDVLERDLEMMAAIRALGEKE
jgi:hypothetical protein